MKQGFTLAEVLITLGIIGVVAALTAPSLMHNVSTASIGPKLGKAYSTIENANKQILVDNGTDSLDKITEDVDEYMELLSGQIANSSFNVGETEASDFDPAPTTYDENELNLANSCRIFYLPGSAALMINENIGGAQYNPRGSYKGYYTLVWIDIDGITSGMNVLGKDIFMFYMDKNGSLIPGGSSAMAWLIGNDNIKYDSATDYQCDENNVGTGHGCAGSIIENDYKVIYQ